MKYVLITGASSGIGKALAEKFAKEGHNLILAARRTNLLKIIKGELKDKYNVDIIIYTVDLLDSDEVQKFYAKTKEYDIEVFINNAGSGDVNLPWNSDIKKIEKMLDLNIKALTTLSIMFIKDNLDKDVQLINVSSTAGYNIISGEITYSASKVFVASWTESVAKQLKRLNKKIKVKVLAPSTTESEFIEKALIHSKNKHWEINAYKKQKKLRAKSAKDLANEGYKLYKNDKILGIIEDNNLKLSNGKYDNIRWI
ncbi:MAG: oxidoreductase [Candidatus Hepatoplasma scabrum]|nr:MAG: oxidoreductase [Candidatus Hepatoplasma sp.]